MEYGYKIKLNRNKVKILSIQKGFLRDIEIFFAYHYYSIINPSIQQILRQYIHRYI